MVVCSNMSGHALMGRPDARLKTVSLVIISYVSVGVLIKGKYFPCIGQFINLWDDTPVFLTETTY